jgi:hypothetical protein
MMKGEPEEQWAAIHVICDDPALKKHREDLCSRVRIFFDDHFQITSPPRVICIFDDQDYGYLKQEFGGTANRAVHWPIRGQRISLWPRHVQDVIAEPDEETGNCAWPFASVVYLHGSTCDSDIGLTLSFAHELQHFLQYVQEWPIWALNFLLIRLGSDEFKNYWDFPIEIQARVTSKRVAEELHGKAAVREFISGRIADHITDNDAEDWKYIQSVDTSIEYPLAAATKPLVQRYRAQLESARQRYGDQPGFAGLDVGAFC